MLYALYFEQWFSKLKKIFFFYVILKSQLAKETKLPIQMHVVIKKFNNV